MSTGLKANNDGSAAIQVGGSDAINLTTGLNVGIGTSSPSVLLDVYGTGSVLGEFIRNNTGSASGGVTIGNNSGTFTIFADTAFSIYDNQAAVSRAAITSTGLFQFNSGYGSVATAYGCRAWAKYNGATTGTNAPTGGGNVTSVTRTGTGLWTINFTNAMPDTDYAVVFGNNNADRNCEIITQNTGTLNIGGWTIETNTRFDITLVCLAVFR